MVARLKSFIVFESVFLLFCVMTAKYWRGEIFFGLVILAVQLVVIIFFWAAVIRPFANLEQTQDVLLEEERTEEELEQIRESIPYAGKIKVLIDRYASKKTRRNSAEIFDKQSELTALQSQINPHFLYNTLETIRGQALMDDNVEIARMVEALSSFFRYSISRKGNLVTLREELANINNYMLIQRYRFNNRFFLEVIIDEDDEEAYDYLIPKLIIQPVVENAIFHGLEERMEGGKVSIEVIVTETNLILTISDNGSGIDGAALKELNNRIHSSNMKLEDGNGKEQRNTGIALPNVHKRIQLLFGEEYGVNIYSTVGQGTDVEITIPVNRERGGNGEDEERGSEN